MSFCEIRWANVLVSIEMKIISVVGVINISRQFFIDVEISKYIQIVMYWNYVL